MPLSLNARNSYVTFPLSFSLTIVYLAYAPIRTPRPENSFGPGRSGAPLGCTTTSLFCLLSYGEIPSYPTKRIACSFNLPYVALLSKHFDQSHPAFPYGYEQPSLVGHTLGSQGRSLRDKRAGTRKKE
jgi:hypothetical protein